MKGYVYVLTNEAMPGLVKIGRSKHAAGVRAKQIYAGDTGVPLPFDVHFECLFDDCVEAEALVHDYLQEHRLNPDREFFSLEPKDAVEWVLRARAEYIDLDVSSPEMSPCESQIYKLASALDEHPFIVATAMDFMTADELRPALARWHERVGHKARPEASQADGKREGEWDE